MDGSMGVLTRHGYDAAHLMGKFQGQKYASAGLPLDECSDMFVYCEEASLCVMVPLAKPRNVAKAYPSSSDKIRPDKQA